MTAVSPSARENLADDIFHRHFGDIDIGHGQFIEQGFAGGDHAVARHFQRDGRGRAHGHFAVAQQFFRRILLRLLALESHELEIREPVHDLRQLAVKEQFAMVDDDDAAAELLDVRHVMAGEHDGGLLLLIVAADEFAHGLLRNHVQADGRFVQKEHLRLVQQRGDELHLHAFAQGKFTHAHVQLVRHAQQLGQLAHGPAEAVLGNAVDLGIELEGFAGGEIPPELVLLPQHQGELPAVGIGAFPRHMAEHARGAAGGIEQAGEHLQRGGLARAIRSEKAHELARLDAEADVIDGDGLLVLAADQAADGPAEAGLLFVGAKGLGQAGDFDGRHEGEIVARS